MDNLPSWGLVEAGKCSRCGDLSFLWTHSLAVETYGYNPIPDVWSSHYQQLACINCHRRFLEAIIHNDNDTYPMSDFRHLVITMPEETTDTETYPFLQECPRCWVCARPLGELRIEAHLSNERTIIVQVHHDCSVLTTCCDTTLPRGMYRDLRGRNQAFGIITSIEGFDKCAECLEKFLTERGHTIDDYFFCASCSYYQHDDEQIRWHGSGFCQTCINEHVFECNDCGEEYWDNDGHDCYSSDDDDEYGGVIHNYDYKPRPYFFGKRSDLRLYFGFELEVECRQENPRETAERVQNLLGDRVYLKSDGSLECGFEIVSHPHSLEELQQHFPWRHFKMFRNELDLRSWNTRTCGLHVHVSRDAFGPYDNRTERTTKSSLQLTKRQAHELRFIKLIYDNEAHVTRLAGRSSPGYANFLDKRKLINKVKWNDTEGGRHAAVNTLNTNTLEVRIFKGSLIPERVLSAVELVHAGVEYTRDLKVNAKNKALSWLAFAGYVHTNLEKYPNLHAYMNVGGRDLEAYDNRTESDDD